MCGITGFIDFTIEYGNEKNKWLHILKNMNASLKKRGPDAQGTYLQNHVAMAHSRLSIRDIEKGNQPIIRVFGEKEYVIVYNGELYNTEELRADLIEKGYDFLTETDTEVVLVGYAHYGIDYLQKINGIFAFVIWDHAEQKAFLCRDRAGIKPLFYTLHGRTLVFGSEIKALLQFPEIEASLDREGLCEILGLGPARTHGVGVFKNFNDIMPGHYVEFNARSFTQTQYWDLTSKPHTDSYDETIEKVRYLVTDSIERQMVSDVPICSLLSGGLDSSVVTAVANKILMERSGQKLNTFSFDFTGNDEFFQSNAFQPERDRPWVDKMVKLLGTNHTYLECSNENLADYLYKAVDAKDLPGMADVDSSLLYFCEKVAEHNKVALTGECADEIFGGYPWFHKKEMFETNMFPWSSDMQARKFLLNKDMLPQIDIDSYTQQRYDETIAHVPLLAGETGDEKRRRELAYLNIKWFMSTLIDRMDRTSMSTGLEARVPYADHRIMEYVFNVPWSIKCKDGMVKHLLRKASEGILPDELLYRKKSPYPKTYNPGYEKILSERITDVLNSPNAPILDLLDVASVKAFIKAPSDYGKPWYGQLMAGPQMMAYLLQINYWLETYHIHISL